MDPQAKPSPGIETTRESSDGANQRRSTRLLVAVPVILSGKDARGEKFREETRTTFINRQGATISVSHIITPGTELQIENPPLGITVRAKAIRFIEKAAPGDLHQVAVELIDLKNVWGIQYPPQDWQKSIPTPAKTEKGKTSPPPKTIEIDLSSSLSPVPAHLKPASSPSAPLSAPIPAAEPPEAAQDVASPEDIGISETSFVKMTRSAAEIDARLHSSLQDALAQLEAKRSDLCVFEERLTGLAQTAAVACTSLEGLLSKAGEAGRHTCEEMEAAAQRLQQVSGEELRSATKDAEEMLLQSMKSAMPALVSEMQQRAAQATSASLQEFEQNCRTALATLTAGTLSSSTKQLEEQQTRTTQEAVKQIELASQATLERFAGELREAAQNAYPSTLSGIQKELIARSAEEIESRHAKALEETKTQTREATRASLEAFCQELQQQAQSFRESMLPEIAREAAAQSAAAFESGRATLNAQAKEEIQLAARAELENFRAELQRASNQAREETVSSSARSAEDLQARQSGVIKEADEKIRDAFEARLEGFQTELENRARQFQQRTVALLEQPAQEIAKYAADTMLMAREEADLLRKTFVEGTHAQLGAITRGTLASMTGESKALTEEYRNQLRAAFESIKEKSVVEMKSDIRQALEEGRESALRQLQKDAEDFSAIAVGQFRGKSEEAIREASDAVNKQVGAAAFVVKEWLDQATQRLETYLSRMEKQSDAAIEAIQSRSRDLSQITLERFRKESETLLLSLRQRIQNASDALTGPLGERARPESETSSLPALEDHSKRALT